jgi:hypothetical protein
VQDNYKMISTYKEFVEAYCPIMKQATQNPHLDLMDMTAFKIQNY